MRRRLPITAATLTAATLALAAAAAAQGQKDKIQELLERSSREANDYSAIVAVVVEATTLQPTQEQGTKYSQLLATLARTLTVHAHAHPVERAAKLIAEAFSRANQRNLVTRANHCRRWAEAALLARDLNILKVALERGASVAAADNHMERAMLATLAARMHAMLGRIEKGFRHADEAIEHAKKFESTLSSETTERYRRIAQANVGPVMRNAIMAKADLLLLVGEHQGVSSVLKEHRQHAVCEPYDLLAGTLSGDSAARDKLLAKCLANELPVRTRAAVAPKLVQHALRSGEDQAAARLFQTLQQGTVHEAFDSGRFSMLEMELALRGQLRVTPAIAKRAHAAFDRMLDEWRNTPRMPGGVGFLHLDDRAALVANLIRFEHRLHPGDTGQQKGMQHVLRAHAASRGDAAPPDLKKIQQQLLGEGHGLLIYLPGRLTSALLVVERTNLQLLAIADTLELRPAVDQLLEEALAEVAKPRNAGARWPKLANALATALLPKELHERLASWQRLTICGAGSLHNAPFELLPIPVDGQVRRLGEHLAIEYTSNLAAATRSKPRRPHTTVALAACLGTTKNGAIKEAVPKQLLRQTIRSYSERLQLFDAKVDATSICQHLKRAGIAHLIGHGFAEWQRNYENGIVFHDGADGALWGERVVNLDLDGLVAILGSCGAGNAPFRRGGEPLAASLAGAMLEAGARCVMVPMSDLRLGHHITAMSHVHAALADGQAPADALLTARKKLAAASDATATLELLLMQLHGRGF